jgi:protein O-GlcNAc transferase
MPQLSVDEAMQKASQHHQAGRLAEAEALYRQILAQHPDHAEALHLIGVLAGQTGHADAAIDLIGRAIQLKPDFPEAYSNLACAHAAKGQIDQAIAAYRTVVKLRPSSAEARHGLATVLRTNGQVDEAIAAYSWAIQLRPNYPQAQSDLGNVLRAKGRFDEAIAAYRQAITLRPNFPEAHINLGITLRVIGQFDDAIAAFQQAIALDPSNAEAHCLLGGALRVNGRLSDAIAAYRQAITLRPNFPEAHSNLIFALHYHPDYDAQSIAEELNRWNIQHAEPLRRLIRPHACDRSVDRHLRIGYVSPDFRDHVVGRNLMPLFQHHDRRQFEIVCYADVLRSDAMTAQFQQHTDCWRNIVGQSDDQVADQVRNDRIDILVDLVLHSGGNRLLVFARKPAPIQVTFAGYPGSTGLKAIDYRLSDPYLDPPGMQKSLCAEQVIRLADSFWCYDPLDCQDIAVNSLPSLKTGVVTFGCLNNFCKKVHDGVLALWAQVLRRVEGSRLLILAPPGSHRQRTLDRMRQEGIDSERIEFLPRHSRRQYLELYHRIDVGLDSFPYNGHTTSLDSFWMGVPVVSLVGQTAVSRAGWCQLSNLGLADLAGKTQEQFAQIAVELANDAQRLQELRSTLRRRMEKSPLMDAPRFAQNIEAAYRQMWRTWCTSFSALS